MSQRPNNRLDPIAPSEVLELRAGVRHNYLRQTEAGEDLLQLDDCKTRRDDLRAERLDPL